MKNQFKLQPVLNYRQTLEDQAKQDLGRCLQKEAELMEAIQVEEQDLGALYRNLERRQQQGISVDELLLYQNRISSKIEQLAHLADRMDRLRDQIVRKREILADAARDKKLLEKLKEKKNLQFQQELKRRETARLDEIAVQFHRRF
jgi:flagellar FliJ protein